MEQKTFPFVYNDGGRSSAEYKGETGDCVVRAIAIVSGVNYQSVYDRINELAQRERITRRKRTRSNARSGVHKNTYNKYLSELGFKWVSCMGIGTGCKVHLRTSEMPSEGKYIVRVSKHLTSLVEGTLQDTFDCSRGGNRCVYGYFVKN